MPGVMRSDDATLSVVVYKTYLIKELIDHCLHNPRLLLLLLLLFVSNLTMLHAVSYGLGYIYSSITVIVVWIASDRITATECLVTHQQTGTWVKFDGRFL